MLLSLSYQLVLFVVDLVLVRTRSDAQLRTEALALRLAPRPRAQGWVVQQAWQLAWRIAEGKLRPRFLLRDSDHKFSLAFDEVFRSEGVEVIRRPVRSPVAKFVRGNVRRHLSSRGA